MILKKKNVAVIGHTGLIGGALFTKAIAEGGRVLGYNRTSADNSLYLGGEADFVIHAAGYAEPARFMADPMNSIEVNTTLLMRLIKNLKPGARLLYLSSSEVYSGIPFPARESDIGTTGPDHARACYIEAKRCGEAICHAARKAGKNVVIARVCSVYGPGAPKNDGRVLSEFIRKGIEDGGITMRDAGNAKRSFLYVDDAARMLFNIMLQGTQDVYNVGGVYVTTVAEVAQMVADRLRVPISIPADRSNPTGAPSNSAVDIQRYIKEFGEAEFTGFADGLDKTIAYFRGLHGL